MRSNVKKVWEQSGLTQGELARRANTTRSNACRIINGQSPTLDLALRIAAALGVPVEKLWSVPKRRKS